MHLRNVEAFAGAAIAAFLLAGCGAAGPNAVDLQAPPLDGGVDLQARDFATADLATPTIAANVRANVNMVVGALVDVAATGASQVVVEWGTNTSYGHTTDAVPLDANGRATVAVFGLPPATLVHLRARTDGATSDDLTLATGPLPKNFPSWNVTVDDGTTDGFIMLSFIGPSFSWGFAVIVDRKGTLEWYFTPPDGYAILDFQQQANGDRTVYAYGAISTHEEVTRLGDIVWRWRDPFGALGADPHDVVLLPNTNALMIGRDVNVYDTSGIVDGGADGATLIDTIVDEIDRDGGTQFHWASYGQVGADETTPDINLNAAQADAQHVNALAVTNDGNILISMRHTDTVYKIDRASGRIAWRLGGKKSDYAFVDDPLNGFSHQHFARQLPNGDLLLLDNGNLHSPPVSRALQYRLDDQKKTATLVWQARHSPDVFSVCCGSAERQANGDTIVDWASTAQGAIVDEYDPFSTVRWELKSAALVYRALHLPSL